jgi:thiol-disulfide isomerase/thioredoxin
MRRRLSVTCALVLILAGCGSAPVLHQNEFPLGRITRADLTTEFLTSYEQSAIEPPFIDMLQKVQDGAEVFVFLGTWCSDSKRDVPRFLRIADEIGMNEGRYTLYSLDRKKESPEGLEKNYQIERVPTFIFLRNGKEIGRIVELPKTTLEGDMLSILAGSM